MKQILTNGAGAEPWEVGMLRVVADDSQRIIQDLCKVADLHVAERDSARSIAATLEQELAETQRRCTALIHLWTTSGSMAHAAQLAEALELGAES